MKRRFFYIPLFVTAILLTISAYKNKTIRFALFKYFPQSNYLTLMEPSAYKEYFLKPVPEWLKETINEELSYFKNHPITQRALNATYNYIESQGSPYNQCLGRYRITGEKLYAKGPAKDSETALILSTLLKLSKLDGVPPIPNVDFIVIHGDYTPDFKAIPNFWITEDSENQAPVLSGSKLKDAPFMVTIPHRSPMAGWDRTAHEVISVRCNWDEKIRKACWRGNICFDVDILKEEDKQLVESCKRSDRFIISFLSKQFPDLIDAGFSKDIDWVESKLLKQLLSPLLKGRLPYKDITRYAYLPNLDGAGISWLGFEWRLLANSLVLKPDSPYVSWLEKGLKPFVHYVPIQSDMSDLISTIRWAKENDDLCREIAGNGRKFAEENLLVEGMYYFLFKMLEEYAKCQDFSSSRLLEESQDDPSWTLVE